MDIPAVLWSVALATALAAAPCQADEVAKVGDLELHCMAIPSLELTPEAAKAYNVERAAGRGVLAVTLVRLIRPGEATAVAGQIYAGALNRNNLIYTIPIREMRDGDQVYYLGEYRVEAPDTLRFLVNANVLGKVLKTEFTRVFEAH